MSSSAKTVPKNKARAGLPSDAPAETEAQKLRRARKMLDELMKESQALAIRAAETAAKLS